MEVCFLADILLNFQLGYQDPDTHELVVDPPTIRARYLRRWDYMRHSDFTATITHCRATCAAGAPSTC
jgi:hypothetical protein